MITEPLDTLSNSFPDKLIAALSPILTDDVLIPCVWSPLTLVILFPGNTSKSILEPILPDNTVPVTIVPKPTFEKTLSIGI